MHGSLVRAIAVLAAALTIGSCGGGAEVGLLAGIIGSGGTGIGVATGFGSVIVDGVRRDDSNATWWSEENQADLVPAASTSAMLGQALEFDYDASGAMSAIRISPALVGPVSAISAQGFTVLGTLILTNADAGRGPVTSLVGYASVSAIQVGDRVAVYGLPGNAAAATPTVQASQIVRKTGGTGVRLTGFVKRFDAASRRFALDGVTIDMAGATVVPSGVPVSDGDLVSVWSDAPATGAVIAASRVRVKWPAAASGNRTLSGLVTDLADSAHFKVQNVAVDASTASVSPAGTTVAASRYVTVSGRYDAPAGRLVASSVSIYSPPAAGPVELHGSVANFVSPSSFTVRGAVVDASAAQFVGGTVSNLANGAFVVIRGAVANDIVRASAVQVIALTPISAPIGATLDLSGTITAFDAATGRYAIALSSGGTMSASMDTAMFFGNGTASTLAVGQSVTVRGVYDGSTLVTSVMSFGMSQMGGGSSAMPGERNMEGVVANVTANGFSMNGVTILATDVTAGGGSMMGGRAMMAGSRVAVTARFSAGQYVATAITLLSD